ncbi:hypothetical protein [Flavobacterium beibuense]|uniref:CarboxypepD_reg domain containing protein n=1 Tax=Flavobacterium beibuense TaxID=657326 RepID=A0A444WDC1_9FLAO|nr:hypothetical protein [Flavobacterium beibuense]RYJ43830.1 CarboxypepD_reg domain containing protein [Flavobacterium beibuense]
MKSCFYFFLILLFTSAFSQTGKIQGKLIIENNDDIALVKQNTLIILFNENRTDTIRPDENLNFTFKNLPEGLYTIKFSPKSYPTDVRYKVTLKSGEALNVNLKYAITCPYKETEDHNCPVCGKNDKVIPIIYGLVIGNRKTKEEEEDKYFPGGCIVSDCQPDWYCERDQKKF